MTNAHPLAAAVADLVARMLPEAFPETALVAAACERTVRAIADGHVCLPLSALAERPFAERPDSEEDDESSESSDADASADATAEERPGDVFPPEAELTDALRRAPAVVFDAASGGNPDESAAPFVLDGGRLYTRRNHRCERRIRERLAAMETRPAEAVPEDSGLLAGLTDEQRDAVSLLCTKPFSILSGGPGTGKTFTLARAVMLARKENPALRLHLAAPTGKASARMKESLLKACADSGAAVPDHVESGTLHRLLGVNPVTGRIKHGPGNLLPVDWLAVDEASMVDLLLFGHLLDALPPDARLTLIGDKDQLASVERGCVLRDLCDAGHPLARLTESKRFPSDGAIAKFAAAVNGGDPDAAVARLRAGDADLVWLEHRSEEADGGPDAWPGFREAVTEGFAAFAAARTPADALAHVSDARVLCAVRRGPYGVERANDFVRAVLPRGTPLPVMITRNDPEQDVRNGDLGVILPADRETVWLEGSEPGAPPRAVPRLLLPDLEPAFATTVHKSQGSEFNSVSIVLPRSEETPLLSREILYTAVTRTRRGVRLWASEAAVRRCAEHAVDRSSGLSLRPVPHPGA